MSVVASSRERTPPVGARGCGAALCVVAGVGLAGCLAKPNPLWSDEGASGTAGGQTGSTSSGQTASSAGQTQTGQTQTGQTQTGQTQTSAAVSSTGASGSTGTPPMVACDDSDPDLVACYDFVGSDAGTLTDLSQYDRDGTTIDVQLELSPTGQAVRVAADSQISVPDGGELELVTALTLEAWVWLDSVPTGPRYGVIDNDGQYSLILLPDQGWRCGIGGDVIVGSAPETGRWSHVACVYDAGTSIVYVDGIEVTRGTVNSSIDTVNTQPVAIADTSPNFMEPLDGLLDLVRIWRVPLSAQAICRAAGRDSC